MFTNHNLGIKEETVVIVPSNFSDEKLGIFLGIAEKIGSEGQRIYRCAAGLRARNTNLKKFSSSDIGLHEASLTKMNVQGSTRTIADSRAIESLGFSSYRWLAQRDRR